MTQGGQARSARRKEPLERLKGQFVTEVLGRFLGELRHSPIAVCETTGRLPHRFARLIAEHGFAELQELGLVERLGEQVGHLLVGGNPGRA